MAHVTVDWNPLGKVFYRKVELYSMEWQDAVDLSRFIVSAAPFGGPIALIRDDKHFAQVQGSAINKPIIHIFSSAGKELATVKWDGGPIVQMGWSVTEDLLCVADDGTVMVYDIHGAIKKTLSMGQDAKESKVIDCKTYNFAGRTGIAILTSNYHFYVANNVEEVRSRRYYDPPGLDAPPSSWVIMPHDRGSSLLVAIDNLLYLTEKGQCNRLVSCSIHSHLFTTSAFSSAVSGFEETCESWTCLEVEFLGPGKVTCGGSPRLSRKRRKREKLIIVFTFSIKRGIRKFPVLRKFARSVMHLQSYYDASQHSVAMLEQRCNHSKQYRKNVATPCCGLRKIVVANSSERSNFQPVENSPVLILFNFQTVSFSAGAPVTSIIEMAISYNYEYLAMFTDTGLLWIGSADLQKVYCEFNTSCPSRPKQLTWCAMGAVICYWDDYLDVIGPTMDTMDSAVHLVQELDGVRIIGNETRELLQRVPAAVEQVFKIGSM
ncbi:unnamed protein product [Porites lobata]|uniref:Vps16 N-terminal domain-containing protein n=1 Tax=Porites lobata TaxID=104759 RepID=A0ABN8P8N2_9CNID|nr:unnamed protein product [Porites lobata]